MRYREFYQSMLSVKKTFFLPTSIRILSLDDWIWLFFSCCLVQ